MLDSKYIDNVSSSNGIEPILTDYAREHTDECFLKIKYTTAMLSTFPYHYYGSSYRDMQQHNRYCSFSWFRTSPEFYETLKRLDQKPLSYGQRQAELYAAQIAWETQNESE